MIGTSAGLFIPGDKSQGNNGGLGALEQSKSADELAVEFLSGALGENFENSQDAARYFLSANRGSLVTKVHSQLPERPPADDEKSVPYYENQVAEFKAGYLALAKLLAEEIKPFAAALQTPRESNNRDIEGKPFARLDSAQVMPWQRVVGFYRIAPSLGSEVVESVQSLFRDALEKSCSEGKSINAAELCDALRQRGFLAPHFRDSAGKIAQRIQLSQGLSNIDLWSLQELLGVSAAKR